MSTNGQTAEILSTRRHDRRVGRNGAHEERADVRKPRRWGIGRVALTSFLVASAFTASVLTMRALDDNDSTVPPHSDETDRDRRPLAERAMGNADARVGLQSTIVQIEADARGGERTPAGHLPDGTPLTQTLVTRGPNSFSVITGEDGSNPQTLSVETSDFTATLQRLGDEAWVLDWEDDSRRVQASTNAVEGEPGHLAMRAGDGLSWDEAFDRVDAAMYGVIPRDGPNTNIRD